MKKAYDSEFWISKDGETIGINLGADFATEHEHGIDEIRWTFGISREPIEYKGFFSSKPLLGIPRFQTKYFPEEQMCLKDFKSEKQDYTVLILEHNGKSDMFLKPVKSWLPYPVDPYQYPNENILCAWDSKSFAIVVKEKYKKDLENIFEAFQQSDIVIGAIPNNIFKNCGLTLLIASKITQSVIEEQFNKDEDKYNLNVMANKTHIRKILEKAGKQYFALTPEWKDESKTDIVFWLNPCQNHLYSDGVFTVDELKAWTKGKGPIIRKISK